MFSTLHHMAQQQYACLLATPQYRSLLTEIRTALNTAPMFKFYAPEQVDDRWVNQATRLYLELSWRIVSLLFVEKSTKSGQNMIVRGLRLALIPDPVESGSIAYDTLMRLLDEKVPAAEAEEADSSDDDARLPPPQLSSKWTTGKWTTCTDPSCTTCRGTPIVVAENTLKADDTVPPLLPPKLVVAAPDTSENALHVQLYYADAKKAAAPLVDYPPAIATVD